MRSTRTIVVLAAVALLLAACAQAAPGWTYAPPSASPSTAASGAASAGASSAPASAAASAGASSAPASAGASPAASGGGGTGTTLQLAAQNIMYDQSSLTAPANTAFSIAFTNNDAGVPHNVTIHSGTPTGQTLFSGDTITGPASTTYNIQALPAGTYYFVCAVHPTVMIGTLTVK